MRQGVTINSVNVHENIIYMKYTTNLALTQSILTKPLELKWAQKSL